MPPFFRPVASMRSLSELPSYPHLLKIGAAASRIFRRVRSPLVINLLRAIASDPPCPCWDHGGLVLWMSVETTRSQVRILIPRNPDLRLEIGSYSASWDQEHRARRRDGRKPRPRVNRARWRHDSYS